MGCGRVGARLAGELDEAGHSVAIIDIDAEAFERLDDDFSGQRVTGNGFHRSVLERAGIEEAYGFIATASGDNSNMVAARTVSQMYQVERVVARISDPERAAFCERLGIPTVAAVLRVSAALMKRVLPPNATTVWDDPTGRVGLCLIRPQSSWIGVPIETVEKLTKSKVAFVARLATVTVPTKNAVVQEQDELYLAIPREEETRVRKILSRAPEERK